MSRMKHPWPRGGRGGRAHSLVPRPKLAVTEGLGTRLARACAIMCSCPWKRNNTALRVRTGATMAVPSQPLEGFYFDELSKIRVIEPDTAGETQELKDECKEFVESERFSN